MKLIMTLFLILMSYSQRSNIIFIAGSDSRTFDISASQQAKILIKGYKQETKTFRFNVSNYDLNNHIKTQKNITVFLFSAGCRKTLDIIKNPYIDARRVFVIEPYAEDSQVRSIIRQSVNLGLPKENIFVGPTRDRGFGVLGNDRVSSSESIDHLSSLEKVGQIIRKRDARFN